MIEINDQEISSLTGSDYSSPGRLFSFWQFILSSLGSLIFLGISLAVVFIVSRAMLSRTGNLDESQALLLIGSGFGFIGFLLIPSAFIALLNLINKPIPRINRLPSAALLILLLLPLLGTGYLASQHEYLSWIVLPPIHVLTIGVAIFWLINLGIRGIPSASVQHLWGIFGTGMVAAPFLSLFMEFVVILGAGTIGIAYLGRSPAFASELTYLYQRFILDPNLPLDTILETLQPYLMQPIVIYGVLIIVALLVPLIEEFFKPIGVWLLAGRNPSPSQGFAAGVVSGAGFALFENLTLSASAGGDWALIMVSRLGTSIIHMLTTGLTGWALALAWREKKYLRLGATYLVAVTIHALWNGLVILSLIPGLLSDQIVFPEIILRISMVSPFGFLIILFGSFVLYVGCNSALKRAIIPPGLETAEGHHLPSEDSVKNKSRGDTR